jgi:hypothetical protein
MRDVRCNKSSENAICSWGYIRTFSVFLHNKQISPLAADENYLINFPFGADENYLM